jgi:F-box/leucine-rich repeat protein 10/11
MVIPDGLTVRAVAELYGPDEKVEVIDVKSQQGEDKKWNMRKWADYYYENAVAKTVRNVISLEVSQSPLGRLIRRPRIVRDLDLQDSVWPAELKAIGDYPKVQFYCLMSVANCYTDFHIDFGGSSVFYHILRGKKTFFFIPPKDKHLKKYEEWCNSAAQDTTFLGNQTKECYRVDLSEGDTMFIPSGWIHAVWTPEDSLVIGGNFLTRMNYGMQIKVAKIEKDTKVPRKFRYPFFQKILWYAAIKYLEDDPIPEKILDAFSRNENYRFYREYPVYYEFGDRANLSPPGSDYYNSRFYSQAELDGLPELAKYLLRTALVAGGYMVDGVSTETRNAIKRSIPKGQGDPVETIRKFGVWIAWKRGNEQAVQWTRPGAISLDVKVDMSDKKTSSRPSRRSERNTAESQRANVERQAARRSSDQLSEPATGLGSTSSSGPSNNSTPAPRNNKSSITYQDEDTLKSRTGPKNAGLGPKRVACDACRKRRIRCRHKDELNGDSFSGRPPSTKQKANNLEIQGRSRPVTVASSFSIIDTNHTIDQRARNNVVGERAAAVGAGDYAGNSMLLNTPQVGSSKVKGVGLNSPNSAKKARSKACDECRKSKVGFSSPSLNNMDHHVLRANSVVAFMTKMVRLILSKLKSDLNQGLPVQQRGPVPVRRTFRTSQASGKSKVQIEIFFTLIYPRQMNLRV